MQDTAKRIVDKLLSVRTLVTIALTFTFCWITNKSFNLFQSNLANKETLPLIEKVLFFLLGSFCTKVGDVITSYFGRQDRFKENGAPK